MARGSGGYSTFVRILKIGLPLLSLGILSTLFLFSSRIDLSQPSPIEGVDVDRLIAEQGIGTPQFVGKTTDGAAVHVQAQRAIPNLRPDGGLDATMVQARIDEPSGAVLRLSAPSATFRNQTDDATLSGGVQINSSAGLVVMTDSLEIGRNFDAITAPGTVTATAPFGELQAGAMQITRDSQENGSTGYRIVFNNGVKLVYRPQNQRNDP